MWVYAIYPHISLSGLSQEQNKEISRTVGVHLHQAGDVEVGGCVGGKG